MVDSIKLSTPAPSEALFKDIDIHKYAISSLARFHTPQFQTFSITGHVTGDLNLPATDTKSPNYCAPCAIRFHSCRDLSRHNMEAHDSKQYVCHVCQRWFKRNDHLKRHVRTLHGEPPAAHYCPTCERSFKRRDHMLRHMDMKHSPESQRYQCAECRDEFGRLELLVQHEQVKHSVAERQLCPHCEVTFKRRDHMLRHVKTKHLNETVPCPLCPSTYKRKDHLVRHLREKHKSEQFPANGHIQT